MGTADISSEWGASLTVPWNFHKLKLCFHRKSHLIIVRLHEYLLPIPPPLRAFS